MPKNSASSLKGQVRSVQLQSGSQLTEEAVKASSQVCAAWSQWVSSVCFFLLRSCEYSPQSHQSGLEITWGEKSGIRPNQTISTTNTILIAYTPLFTIVKRNRKVSFSTWCFSHDTMMKWGCFYGTSWTSGVAPQLTQLQSTVTLPAALSQGTDPKLSEASDWLATKFSPNLHSTLAWVSSGHSYLANNFNFK